MKAPFAASVTDYSRTVPSSIFFGDYPLSNFNVNLISAWHTDFSTKHESPLDITQAGLVLRLFEVSRAKAQSEVLRSVIPRESEGTKKDFSLR
jgi:hypothetical protein